MPFNRQGDGGDGGSLIDQWDWQEKKRQRDIQPIRGNQVTPTPQTETPPICGRNIDSSVVAGAQDGIPIAPNAVTSKFLGANPATLTPPAFQVAPHNAAHTGVFDYIGAGAGAYDAETTFQITAPPPGTQGLKPGWLDVLRAYAVPTGAAFNPSAVKNDIASRLDGTYTLIVPGMGAGTQYDIYLAYVDHSGVASAPVLIGTTAANAIALARGSLAAGAAGVTPVVTGGSGNVNFSNDGVTAATTDFINTAIQTDANGKSSNPWLAEVLCVAAVSGTSNWAVVSKIAPNASGAYAGVWPGCGAGGGYDLGIQYTDFQGNLSNVLKLATNITPALIPSSALLPNPNPSVAPAFSVAPSAFSYVAAPSGAGSYDAITTFTLTTTNPPWLAEIRLYALKTGSAFTYSASKGDLVVASSGAYTAIFAGLSAGTAYDLYIAFIDQRGSASLQASVGTTAANALTVAYGNQASGASGVSPAVTAAGTFAAAPYTGVVGGTTDILNTNFTLGANGTTNGSPWLAEVVLVSRLNGSGTSLVPQASGYTWSPVGKIAPNASSGVYSGVWAALGSGMTYDLGVQYEDYQGNLSNVAVLKTAFTCTPITVAPGSLPQIPAGLTFTAAIPSASYSGVNAGAYSVTGTVTITITANGGTVANWLAEVDIYTSTDGSNWSLGTKIPTSSVGSLPFTIAGLGAGQSYYLAAQLVAVDASSVSTLNSTGWATTAQTIGNTSMKAMPSAIFSGGPTISASSVSHSTFGHGAGIRYHLSITETDFTTAIPAWLDKIWITKRVTGDSDTGANNEDESIDPRLSTTGVYQKTLMCDAGETYDFGVYYSDQTGQNSAIYYPAGINNKTDPNGQWLDANAQITHARSSSQTQAVIDTNKNILNTEFPAAKLQPDGSLTNVHGTASVTVYTLVSNQPFSVSADIAKGVSAGTSGLLFGNNTNGYAIWYDGTPQAYLLKYVAGVASVIGSAGPAGTKDTAYHSLRLTLTPGSPNNLEGSVDGQSFAYTDSSLTLTSGTWPVTVYAGDSTGKMQHYHAAATPIHQSHLPSRIKGAFIPPDQGLPIDGLPLAPGQLTGRHFHGGNSTDTGDFVDNTGTTLYGRHHVGVRGTINSTTDSDGTYLTHGQVHSTHLVTGTSGNAIDLDAIPDGRSVYARPRANQLIGGAMARGGLGKNVLPNPSFEINEVNTPAYTAIAVGAPISNGWYVQEVDNASVGYVGLANDGGHSGGNCLWFRTNGSNTIAANAVIGIRVRSATFPIRVGDIVSIGGFYNAQSSMGNLPTGIQALTRFALLVVDSAGGGAAEPGYDTPVTTPPGVWYGVTTTYTVPATLSSGKAPSTAQFECCVFLENTTGSPITLPSGVFDIRMDDVTWVINAQHTELSTQTQAAIVAAADSDGTYLAHGQVHAPHVVFGTSGNQINIDHLPDNVNAKIKASHVQGGVAYNYKGVWSSATAYVQGDEVVYGPSYWLALAGSTNSAPATSNGNWQVVGTYSGYQGAWSSATAYIAGAEVTYNGNYWVCITANTNSAPTTSNANWQVAGPSSLDNIADGSIYARPKGSELVSGVITRIGDGGGTNFRTYGHISGAIDTSSRVIGNIFDGTNTRTPANLTTALDGSGRLIGNIYDGTSQLTPSVFTGTLQSTLNGQSYLKSNSVGSSHVASGQIADTHMNTGSQTYVGGAVRAFTALNSSNQLTTAITDGTTAITPTIFTSTLQTSLNAGSYLKSGVVDLSTHTNATRLPQGKHHAYLDTALTAGTVDVAGKLNAANVDPAHGSLPLAAHDVTGQTQWLLAQSQSKGLSLLENADFLQPAVSGSGDLIAGWYVQSNDGALFQFITETPFGNPPTTANDVVLRVLGNTSVPANSTQYAVLRQHRAIALSPGQNYVMSCWMRNDNNVGIPSGLSINQKIELIVAYSNGTYDFLDTGGPTSNNGTWTNYGASTVLTIPTPAGKYITGVFATLVLGVTNNTGSVIVTPNGLMSDARYNFPSVTRMVSFAEHHTAVQGTMQPGLNGQSYLKTGAVGATHVAAGQISDTHIGTLGLGTLTPTSRTLDNIVKGYAPRKNLLVNGNNCGGTGSVAPGTYGWTNIFNGANVTSGGSYGSFNSIHINTPTASQCGVWQEVPCSPGQTYTLSALVYGGSTISPGVYVTAGGGFGTQLNSSSALPINAPASNTPSNAPMFYQSASQCVNSWTAGLAGWTFVYQTFTIPTTSTITSLRVMLYNTSNTAGDGFYQGVMLTEGNRLQDYVDHELNSGAVHDRHLATSSNTYIGADRGKNAIDSGYKLLYGSYDSTYTANWDSSGNTKISTGWNSKVPSMLSWSADLYFAMLASSTADGSGNYPIYFSLTSTAGFSTNITIVNPDQSSYTAPYLGTSVNSTASMISSGYSGPPSTGVYGMAYFIKGDTSGVSGTGWHVVIQGSQMTPAQLALANKDGGYVAMFATRNSNSFNVGASGGGGKSGAGCPEISQIIERKREKIVEFVRADALAEGDYLRDPLDRGWNRIYKPIKISPCTVWEVSIGGERVLVDDTHLFMDAFDQWICVTDLKAGHLMHVYPGGYGRVEYCRELRKGEFVHITCERHRYVLGRTVSHNTKVQ